MRVSIITVSYNAEAYIAQTIESVLSQNYDDLEYILVDGCSTDRTVDIIRSYQDDPRVRWVSEPDAGIADAMNKGCALATGEIFAHLNADDYYVHPQVVPHVVACFNRKPETLWLTGGFDFVNTEGEFLRSVRVRRYSFSRLVRGNIILHPSTFIRKRAFEEVGGFDPSLRYCMDYDLFLRLGQKAPPFLLDEQLSCFRSHVGSRTITESEYSYAEEFKVRMRYLNNQGRSTWFYTLDYQLKRQLNKIFYRRLQSSKQQED